MGQSAAVITEKSVVLEIGEGKTVFDAGETVTFKCIVYDTDILLSIHWLFINDLGFQIIKTFFSKDASYAHENVLIVDKQYPGDFASWKTEENIQGQRVQVIWLKVFGKCSTF